MELGSCAIQARPDRACITMSWCNGLLIHTIVMHLDPKYVRSHSALIGNLQNKERKIPLSVV